jgi:hypothetical protein
MRRNISVLLKGIVTEFKWANPHTWIYLSVDDGTGGKVEWHLEGRPPGILGRAGWTKTSLKPGSDVIILCNPAKDGSRVAKVLRVTPSNEYVLANEPSGLPHRQILAAQRPDDGEGADPLHCAARARGPNRPTSSNVV